jgi:hypothetical protein
LPPVGRHAEKSADHLDPGVLVSRDAVLQLRHRIAAEVEHLVEHHVDQRGARVAGAEVNRVDVSASAKMMPMHWGSWGRTKAGAFGASGCES